MRSKTIKTYCTTTKTECKTSKTLCIIAKIKRQKTKMWGLLANPTS